MFLTPAWSVRGVLGVQGRQACLPGGGCTLPRPAPQDRAVYPAAVPPTNPPSPEELGRGLQGPERTEQRGVGPAVGTGGHGQHALETPTPLTPCLSATPQQTVQAGHGNPLSMS